MRTLFAPLACFPLWLCGCATASTGTPEDAQPRQRSTMDPTESHLSRAEALVRRGTGSDEVVPAEPVPPVSDLGARAGFGRAWTSSSARASVYLFDTYDDASAAEDRLRAQTPAGQQARGTVNGALLVWATADAKDEAGGAAIGRLLSSFAGDE